MLHRTRSLIRAAVGLLAWACLQARAETYVVGWGWNGCGQLGNARTANRELTPVRATGLTDVTQVAGAWAHSVALAGDGTVWAWGRNAERQLGNGTVTDRRTPGRVTDTGMGKARCVAASNESSAAVGVDGRVWSWGRTFETVLGYRGTPRVLPDITGAVSVSLGSRHGVVLLADGTVRTWGMGGDGRLGNGSTRAAAVPVAVPGLAGVVAIAAGRAHSLALTSAGTVWAWGDNTYGQLGDGTTRDRSRPVPVLGLAGITALAAGGDFSLALTDAGTVWAWGDNGYGQLGAGAPSGWSTAGCPTPVQVPGLTGVTAIGAAGRTEYSDRGHAGYAVCDNDTVWAWGLNGYGQLGDGTTETRSVPAPVPGLVNGRAVTGGDKFALAIVDYVPRTLTLAVSPAGGGSTSPASGGHTVADGEVQAISAAPAAGYRFLHWSIEGSATVAEPYAAATSVVVRGDATVTAVFATLAESAVLTFAVSPAGAGTTVPASPIAVLRGEPTPIAATPGRVWDFAGWSASGRAAEFADSGAAQTTVTVTGDTAITADFAIRHAQLQVTADPPAGGQVEPVSAVVEQGAATPVAATPAGGYVFLGWSAADPEAKIADTLAAATTARLYGNTALVAHFAPLPSLRKFQFKAAHRAFMQTYSEEGETWSEESSRDTYSFTAQFDLRNTGFSPAALGDDSAVYVRFADYEFHGLLGEARRGTTDDDRRFNSLRLTSRGGAATFVVAEDVGMGDTPRYVRVETLTLTWTLTMLTVTLTGTPPAGAEYNLFDLSEAEVGPFTGEVANARVVLGPTGWELPTTVRLGYTGAVTVKLIGPPDDVYELYSWSLTGKAGPRP